MGEQLVLQENFFVEQVLPGWDEPAPHPGGTRRLPGAVPYAAGPAPHIALDQQIPQSADLQLVNIGPSAHFLPEDQPEAISRALATWLPPS